MDNKSYIYLKTLTSLPKWGPGGGGGGGGASIIRLGPSWFTYTLHLIIIYMSNIETELINIIYICFKAPQTS